MICSAVYSAALQDMFIRHNSRCGCVYHCIYLSSFFSDRLSGIALNIRTRSLSDRFCRLFTKRSLLFSTNTHRHHTGSARHSLRCFGASYVISVLSPSSSKPAASVSTPYPRMLGRADRGKCWMEGLLCLRLRSCMVRLQYWEMIAPRLRPNQRDSTEIIWRHQWAIERKRHKLHRKSEPGNQI